MKQPETPSNVPAEQAVLGSILLDPAAISLVELEAREFYLEKHGTIYTAMQTVHHNGQQPDFITVCAELTRRKELENVGGASYLTSLLNGFPSGALVEQYAGYVRRDRIRRELIDASTHIAHLGYNGAQVETVDLLGAAIAKLRAIESVERGDVLTLHDAVLRFMPQLEAYREEQRTVWGIPTGMDIDKYLGGVQTGHLWVIGGYPGKGKTSFVLNVLEVLTMARVECILFSLEMSCDELMMRLISAHGKTNSEDIKRGRVTDEQYAGLVEKMGQLGCGTLRIVDKGQTTESIRAHVARLKDSGVDLKVVAIDYLRLLRDRGDEPARTNNIAVACKNLARDFDVNVMLVMSLNRKLDSETEPTLQSLNQGGDFDADVVMFPHFKKDRTNDDAKIVIEKHRHGRTGDVPMLFNGATTQWRNPAQKAAPEERDEYTFGVPVPVWDDALVMEAR